MKQPRTSDFDPHAAEHADHRLKSSMESFPKIMKLSQQATQQPQGASLVVNVPETSPNTKRPIRRRHPFDIYQDQFIELRQLSMKKKANGETGSMSEMVRAALDAYLGKR